MKKMLFGLHFSLLENQTFVGFSDCSKRWFKLRILLNEKYLQY